LGKPYLIERTATDKVVRERKTDGKAIARKVFQLQPTDMNSETNTSQTKSSRGREKRGEKGGGRTQCDASYSLSLSLSPLSSAVECCLCPHLLVGLKGNE
jgi:hypothetical protein